MSQRLAIVTGASSGIGRATANELARHGWKLALVDIDANGLATTANQITDAGSSAISFVHDLGQATGFDEIVASILDSGQRIDALVNVAGVVGVAAGAAVTTDEQWQMAIDINLTGVFRTCRSVLPSMIEAGTGSIVNVASVAGLVGIANRGAYCASKGGVIAFTRALAADYAKDGLRINAICPGTVETEWITKLLANADNPVEMRQRLEQRQLDNRLGAPEEVAAGIRFLLSDEGRFVNGSAFVMDGGLTTV